MRKRIKPMTKQLSDFPEEIVTRTATDYTKSFHSKTFTLFAASESELNRFARRFSPHYGYGFSFFTNDIEHWFLDWKGVLRVRDWIIKTINQKGSEPIFEVYNLWRTDWARFEEIRRKVDGTDLSALSDEEFYSLFEDVYVGYLEAGSVAYMADTFMSTGETDWLEERLKEECRKAGVTKNIEETVRVLCNPLCNSYTIDEEWRLAEIGILLNKTASAPFPPISELSATYPALYEALAEHAQAFFWIHNNYFNVEVLNAEYFYDQLRKKAAELQSLGSSFEEIVEKHDREAVDAQRKRDALVRTIPLSEFALELLKTAWLFAEWKDVRKAGSYIGMHYFDLFLEELARRTGYSKPDLTHIVFPEVRGLLFERQDLSRLIASRKQQTFFAVTPEGYFLTEGDAANRYFRFLKKDASETTECKGVPACKGFAKGAVRVIRTTEDFARFQKGEILVTNQTTPEFVPIMKKAAAIITEQGGITSHAAVISRELNVPCIIGIRGVTGMLQTGDRVEVDAERGIVKKLS